MTNICPSEVFDKGRENAKNVMVSIKILHLICEYEGNTIKLKQDMTNYIAS